MYLDKCCNSDFVDQCSKANKRFFCIDICDYLYLLISDHINIYLYLSTTVYLSACLSLCLPACLSVCLYVCVCLSIYLFIVYPSIYLSIYLSNLSLYIYFGYWLQLILETIGGLKTVVNIKLGFQQVKTCSCTNKYHLEVAGVKFVAYFIVRKSFDLALFWKRS